MDIQSNPPRPKKKSLLNMRIVKGESNMSPEEEKRYTDLNDKYFMLSNSVKYITYDLSDWENFDFSELQKIIKQMKKIQTELLDILNGVGGIDDMDLLIK